MPRVFQYVVVIIIVHVRRSSQHQVLVLGSRRSRCVIREVRTAGVAHVRGITRHDVINPIVMNAQMVVGLAAVLDGKFPIPRRVVVRASGEAVFRQAAPIQKFGDSLQLRRPNGFAAGSKLTKMKPCHISTCNDGKRQLASSKPSIDFPETPRRLPSR